MRVWKAKSANESAWARFMRASSQDKLRKLQRRASREHWQRSIKTRQWQEFAREGKDYARAHGRETFLVSTRDQVISRGTYIEGEWDFVKFSRALGLLGHSKVGC